MSYKHINMCVCKVSTVHLKLMWALLKKESRSEINAQHAVTKKKTQKSFRFRV